jgi:hypothetical protein
MFLDIIYIERLKMEETHIENNKSPCDDCKSNNCIDCPCRYWDEERDKKCFTN